MAASSGARLLFGNSARRWLGDFTKLLPKVLRPLLAQCDNASPALRRAWLGRAVEGRARAGRHREQATGGSRRRAFRRQDNQRRQTAACGARTAEGSLEAIFESSDVERFGWILMEAEETALFL